MKVENQESKIVKVFHINYFIPISLEIMNEEKRKKLEWMVQEIITQIIFEEAEWIEEEHGVLTVTWVKISSELSYLDVYVSCFLKQDTLAHDIAKHNFKIQRRLNKSLSLYKLPKIRFRYDDSWRIAEGIDGLIREIQKEIS